MNTQGNLKNLILYRSIYQYVFNYKHIKHRTRFCGKYEGVRYNSYFPSSAVHLGGKISWQNNEKHKRVYNYVINFVVQMCWFCSFICVFACFYCEWYNELCRWKKIKQDWKPFQVRVSQICSSTLIIENALQHVAFEVKSIVYRVLITYYRILKILRCHIGK